MFPLSHLELDRQSPYTDGSADPLVRLLPIPIAGSRSSRNRSFCGNLLSAFDCQFPGALIPRYACCYDRLAKTV